MKKLKIGAFLRPAIYEDIFNEEEDFFFRKNKQVYFLEKDNTIRGPYTITTPDFFPAVEYQRYLDLIYLQKVLVVDGKQYQESIMVRLPLKSATLNEILGYNHFNGLIINKMFYIITEDVSGPFVITKMTKETDIKKYINLNQFFVLDHVSTINKIENIAKAV